MAATLYYSPRDRYSRNLVQELRGGSSSSDSEVALVDVDTRQVPPYITHVPTLVLGGGQGSGSGVLVGKAAFDWVKKRRQAAAADRSSSIGDWDSGSMGGASLGHSELDGDGSVTSQQQFVYLRDFGEDA